MRGAGPSTFKPGLIPGLVAGIAIAVVVVIAVGGISVGAKALGPKSTIQSPARPSGSNASALPSGSGSHAPAASTSATAKASVTPRPTPSPRPTAVVTAPGNGPIASEKIVFDLNSGSQSWMPDQAAGFDLQPDSTFGVTGTPSLAGSFDSGSSPGLSGRVTWDGAWTQLLVPPGKHVVAITSSIDCYLDSVSGGSSTGVGLRLDLMDSAGQRVAAVLPPKSCSKVGRWTTLSGPVALVPDYVSSSDNSIRLVITAGTDWSGQARFHLDNIRFAILYR